MNLLQMEERHIAALAEIEKTCFSQPWSTDGLREELDNPNALFLVAEDAEIVGYIGCQTVLDEGYITNVAVASAHRRRGVGRALVRGLKARAIEKKLSFLTLEVRASNAPAIGLYVGEGFEVVGTRKSYYTTPVEDATLMTAHLSKK